MRTHPMCSHQLWRALAQPVLLLIDRLYVSICGRDSKDRSTAGQDISALVHLAPFVLRELRPAARLQRTQQQSDNML